MNLLVWCSWSCLGGKIGLSITFFLKGNCNDTFYLWLHLFIKIYEFVCSCFQVVLCICVLHGTVFFNQGSNQLLEWLMIPSVQILWNMLWSWHTSHPIKRHSLGVWTFPSKEISWLKILLLWPEISFGGSCRKSRSQWWVQVVASDDWAASRSVFLPWLRRAKADQVKS